MILYALRCEKEHVSEQWFENMADFDAKAKSGSLSCPDCGSHQMSKAIMAPRVGKSAPSAMPMPACGTPDCGNRMCPMMAGGM